MLVADDFHEAGLGQKLVDMLIGIAQEKGLKSSMYGVVLKDNARTLGLARSLGFTVTMVTGDEVRVSPWNSRGHCLRQLPQNALTMTA